MKLSVTKSGNACGADIKFDLSSELDDRTFAEIELISNIKDENGENIGLADAGFTWHTDVSYLKRPSRCSLLYAKEVPYRDGRPLGDTLFTNTIAAYEALPETMKRRLTGLKAIHRYSARKRVANR